MNILNLQCSIGQPHKGVSISNKNIINLFPANIRPLLDIQRIENFIFEEQPSKVLLKCINSQQSYERTLFFGGDHYASFFTILSSLVVHGDNFRLIWLDAHGDIHNMKTSPSGNRHGMPVRFLMEHTLPGIPRLNPKQILYIGLRDLEKAEWAYINRRKIQYIKSADVAANLDKISNFIKGHKIHISLDVDVLDPSIMPCTGTLADGGLSMDILIRVFNIIKPESIIAIDIMEYNPLLGNKTEKNISKHTMIYLMNIIYKMNIHKKII